MLASGATGSTANPSVSTIHSIFSACGRWKSGSSTTGDGNPTPVPSDPPMYRFLLRPRWLLFHLACIGAVVLMVSLGFWQLRRLDERQAFNATVEARIDQPPIPLADVPAERATSTRSSGARSSPPASTCPTKRLVVVNRSQGGRAGDIVVTPLLLDDGRILLVERGFVPFGAVADAPPTGPVEVVGRLRPSEQRRRGQVSDSATGELTEAQRLDIDRLAAQLPGPPVGFFVELDRVDARRDGPVPRAARRTRAERGLRTCPTPASGSSSPPASSSGGCSPSDTRCGLGGPAGHGGVAASRRRTRQGSRRHCAAIARLTALGGESTRRYADHTSTGRSKKQAKNSASSFAGRRMSTFSPWSCRRRVRRSDDGQTARWIGRTSGRPAADSASAIAVATRGAARSAVATENPVTGFV